MRGRLWIGVVGVVALGACAVGASAKLTPEELARLGADLTPLGAEMAGNRDGTIPSWEGGLVEPPPGWDREQGYIDPYADDPVLFTITRENMDQYADRLTEGHKALLRTYGTYKMKVYPTRRSAAFPQSVYAGTRRTAATAELIDGGNGVTGAVGGTPFPIPESGVEVVWNTILRYFLSFTAREHNIAAVTRSGEYSLTKVKDWAYIPYWEPGMTEQRMDNILFYYKQNLVSPPRVAGRVLLLHETVNQAAEARKAWIYNPGQRRVRRAPEYSFDNPWEGSDGLMTIDSNLMFNGSPERYDWKLLGKRELYVPYNPYKAISKSLQYEEIIEPLHINQDVARYELHRVWVVEGTLKEGQRHLYQRRTMYVDEDSWLGIVVDMYDNRGDLWRVAESHNATYYDLPALAYGLETQYDLQEGRYVLNWLANEEPTWVLTAPEKKEASFTTQALRRAGTR